jgi:hypothetical protein
MLSKKFSSNKDVQTHLNGLIYSDLNGRYVGACTIEYAKSDFGDTAHRAMNISRPFGIYYSCHHRG